MLLAPVESKSPAKRVFKFLAAFQFKVNNPSQDLSLMLKNYLISTIRERLLKSQILIWLFVDGFDRVNCFLLSLSCRLAANALRFFQFFLSNFLLTFLRYIRTP